MHTQTREAHGGAIHRLFGRTQPLAEEPEPPGGQLERFGERDAPGGRSCYLLTANCFHLPPHPFAAWERTVAGVYPCGAGCFSLCVLGLGSLRIWWIYQVGKKQLGGPGAHSPRLRVCVLMFPGKLFCIIVWRLLFFSGTGSG